VTVLPFPTQYEISAVDRARWIARQAEEVAAANPNPWTVMDAINAKQRFAAALAKEAGIHTRGEG
tara:strand:- start:6326 stop:6520 length:195 start_codon:yes stop_codon:yes gene_type:complete